MDRRGALLLGLYGCLSASTAYADSPPPPAADWDTPSQNGRFVAHGDLHSNKIIIQQRTEHGVRSLWAIEPWQYENGFYLSDDGQGLAYCHETGIRSGLDQKILTLFYRGTVVRIWYLRDFFRETESLPRSVSHMQWATASQWNGPKFIVTTVDGRTLTFDETTGELRN